MHREVKLHMCWKDRLQPLQSTSQRRRVYRLIVLILRRALNYTIQWIINLYILRKLFVKALNLLSHVFRFRHSRHLSVLLFILDQHTKLLKDGVPQNIDIILLIFLRTFTNQGLD